MEKKVNAVKKVERVVVNIPGYPGYGIDNFGTPWSCKSGIWKEMTPQRRPDGYLTVTLRKNNKNFVKRIPRLVLEGFVGPCPRNKEASHLDADKENNCLSNLSWQNHKENMRNAFLKKCSTGERNKTAKLHPLDIRDIKDMSDDGIRVKEIADEYEVTPTTIYGILNEKHWWWITEKMELELIQEED